MHECAKQHIKIFHEIKDLHLLPLTILLFYHHSLMISNTLNRYVIEINSIE